MKAVVKASRGIGNIEVRDVPEPTPGPDELKIAVRAAAICATDIHIYYDEYINCPPVILGHEMSGVVVEVGERVKNFRVGDRVTSETFKYTCGACRFCQAGLIGLCIERQSMGVHVDGAFAKYVVQREESLHRLPNNVAFLEGALCEPMATAVRAVYERATIVPADVVVVSGPGAIGLLCVQAAKALGATVILCGTADDGVRLDLGKRLGADVVVDVAQTQLLGAVHELTGGLGADVVFECAGAQASLNQCIQVARKGAQVVLVGLFGHEVKADVDQMIVKELTVLPSFTYEHRTWRRALKLLSQGTIKTEPLVSGCFPLTDWERAFEAMQSRRGHRYLLIPVD